MDFDNIIYFISILTLISIVITIRYSRIFFFINIFLFTLYSAYFYYGLFYQREGGAVMAWWFYNLIFTTLHFLIIIGYLIQKKVVKKN